SRGRVGGKQHRPAIVVLYQRSFAQLAEGGDQVLRILGDNVRRGQFFRTSHHVGVAAIDAHAVVRLRATAEGTCVQRAPAAGHCALGVDEVPIQDTEV